MLETHAALGLLKEISMHGFWTRWTPLLLDIEPLAAGIAGVLLLLALWLFAG